MEQAFSCGWKEHASRKRVNLWGKTRSRSSLQTANIPKGKKKKKRTEQLSQVFHFKFTSHAKDGMSNGAESKLERPHM